MLSSEPLHGFCVITGRHSLTTGGKLAEPVKDVIFNNIILYDNSHVKKN